MGGSHTPSAVAMEIFVEQDVVAEMRIRLQLVVFAKHWSPTRGVSQKNSLKPPVGPAAGALAGDDSRHVVGIEPDHRCHVLEKAR